MFFSLNKTKTSLTGIINSKSYNLPYDELLYSKLSSLERNFLAAETANYANAILKQATAIITDAEDSLKPKNSFISEKLFFKDGKYYLIAKNGTVSLAPIPNDLVDRMSSAKSAGLPVDPYINAWTLFLRNPNFSLKKAEYFSKYLTAKYLDEELYEKYKKEGYSDNKAREYATYDEVSITPSGLISTYKYVDYEGVCERTARDVYQNSPGIHAEDCIFLPPVMRRTGDPVIVEGVKQHEVVIGKLHSLESWDQVNCNDSRSCVKGLHIGSQTYIRCYGGRTRFLLNCLVSPSDIGAFVQHRGAADEGALRVKCYYPVSVNIAPNKGRYHESLLLQKVDEEWEVERALAIEDANAKIASIRSTIEQLNSF